jgi:phasin family protein
MSIKNTPSEALPEPTAPIPAAAKGIEAAARSAGKFADVGSKSLEATISKVEEGTAKAAAGFSETQAKVKASMDNAMKTAEELVTFGQGNIEAMMKSGQIWVSGVQDLSRQLAASAQASFEETVSTFKQLSGVKSLKDAMDLQSNLARATMEKTLAESGRLTDASFKLAEQALAPITARVTLAVEKFSKTV